MQLSSHDHKGGAARIAWYLHETYKFSGIDSYLIVGNKTLDDEQIIELNNSKYQKENFLFKVNKWARIIMGFEFYDYPATGEIPEILNPKPDIIHAHNLHGRYFDLRQLPTISNQFPTVLTLHDTWLFCGLCVYFIGCNRWKNGCGKCPQVRNSMNPRLDSTSVNWRRKKNIIDNSIINVVTPSRWLLEQVQNSFLASSIKRSKVIHNGVDLSQFFPVDKSDVRVELNLPQDAFIILYTVSSKLKTNPYKDYKTIETALGYLQEAIKPTRKVLFLGLGEEGNTEIINNLEKRYIPYQADIKKVAKYYQCADVFIHAAHADTFPNTILESIACGTPVIATGVGGIPEQIKDGFTGFIVEPAGAKAMASKIKILMDDDILRKEMSKNAAKDAILRFSISRMAIEYLDFYKEVI